MYQLLEQNQEHCVAVESEEVDHGCGLNQLDVFIYCKCRCQPEAEFCFLLACSIELFAGSPVCLQ